MAPAPLPPRPPPKANKPNGEPTPGESSTRIAAPTSEEREKPELSPGQLLDHKYELIRCLGEGGMGSVWVARNTALDIEVAVKFIRADLEAKAGAVGTRRLMAEARAMAALSHEAIVRCFDYGTTPRGTPYIVMELLRGKDLETTLDEKGKLEAAQAVSILLPVAHGLAKAHSRGLVHRDIKPDNIFLERTEEGAIQPKLIDFGVVKVDAADSDMKLTREGAMVGSPCYLSPEQARGEDATAQSDVWAFSVVLYETLTGQLPFDADNFRALLRTIVENEPAPIAEHGVVDEELWQIIARGLSKDTDGRWKSIHDMGVALAEWLVAQGYEEDCRGNFIESTWLGGRPSLASLDVLEQWPPPAARPPSRRTPISQRQLPSDDEIRKLRSGSHSSLSGTDLTETVESSLVEVDPQATTRRRLVAGIAIVAFLVTAWVALRRPPEDTSHATETTAAPSAVAAPSASAAPPASVTTEAASGSAEPVASAASPPSASPVASSAPVPVPTPTPKAPPRPNPPGLMTPDF